MYHNQRGGPRARAAFRPDSVSIGGEAGFRFRMYRADQDSSWVIPRIGQVGAWLGEHEHEHEHAGLSPPGEQWKAAAGELQRRQDEDGESWKLSDVHARPGRASPGAGPT